MSLPFKQIHVFYAQREAIIFNESIETIYEEITKQLSFNPQDIKLLLIQVQILHQYKNDYKAALNLIRQVLELDPLNIDARLDITDIIRYHRVGNQEEAKTLVEECKGIDSSYWRTYFIEIKLYDSLKLSNMLMLSKVKEFLLMFPENIWLLAYYWQIQTDIDNKALKEDLDWLKSSKYLDFEMLRRLAYIVKNKGDMKFALECEEYCLKLNPNSFYCLNNFGYSQNSYNKNAALSIECYEKAVKNNPNYATAIKNLGIMYQNVDIKKSIFYFKRLLEIQKRNAYAYSMIASNYQDLTDLKSGLYYARKGTHEVPGNFILYVQYLDLIVNYNQYRIPDFEEYLEVSYQALNCPDLNYEIGNDIAFITSNLNYLSEQPQN